MGYPIIIRFRLGLKPSLQAAAGARQSCMCRCAEAARPREVQTGSVVGYYTRPPNSTLSLPFPGMTNTLYTIAPLIKVSERGKTPPKIDPSLV